jgi:hypothetical protein
MLKHFLESDVRAHTAIDGAGKLFASTDELLYDPLDWQKRGLQQTATGYGAKLTSPYKINFEDKLYRLYVTQYGNAGSTWFRVRGRKIFVG